MLLIPQTAAQLSWEALRALLVILMWLLCIAGIPMQTHCRSSTVVRRVCRRN